LSYTNICASLSTTPTSALTRAYASRAPSPSPRASVSRTYASTSKLGESRSTLARVARPVVVVVVVASTRRHRHRFLGAECPNRCCYHMGVFGLY